MSWCIGVDKLQRRVCMCRRRAATPPTHAARTRSDAGPNPPRQISPGSAHFGTSWPDWNGRDAGSGHTTRVKVSARGIVNGYTSEQPPPTQLPTDWTRNPTRNRRWDKGKSRVGRGSVIRKVGVWCDRNGAREKGREIRNALE